MLFCLCGPVPAVAQDCDDIAHFVRDPAQFDLAACEDDVCMWRFGYRDQAAHDRFERLGALLELCLGRELALDDSVNHPDSYQLRRFQIDDATVFLSIKDKASLRQTLVFLRKGS
ncbi:hypothetical protein [Roseovarius aestuariivivens]|uniref:hypothetical protein n=1 Tax=Roseovarius aestuariivivens TaxID=1888910 RepID=UPI0010808328|nr:hypothetical protein [Roseovarius aestuariivivens]